MLAARSDTISWKERMRSSHERARWSSRTCTRGEGTRRDEKGDEMQRAVRGGTRRYEEVRGGTRRSVRCSDANEMQPDAGWCCGIGQPHLDENVEEEVLDGPEDLCERVPR